MQFLKNKMWYYKKSSSYNHTQNLVNILLQIFHLTMHLLLKVVYTKEYVIDNNQINLKCWSASLALETPDTSSSPVVLRFS